MNEDIQIVVITGMSGAGKTVTVQSLEDLGYFCIDNLPPALIPKLLDLIESGSMNRVALVMDLRGREFFDQVFSAVSMLGDKPNLHTHILFLDADNEKLVQRYKETRRSHPLAPNGSLLEGIEKERKILEEIKGRARHRIDTTSLKPKELREEINRLFTKPEEQTFTVHFMSFGFKHGVPIDADLVFDVRFLPNPHYIDRLRPMTGLDKDVSDYVLKWDDTKVFIEKLEDLLTFMLPLYKQEGKSQLIVAIGCTGGQHRSVTLVEYFANLYESAYPVHRSHRDRKVGGERS
ncbi:RNase adapter RapZ [Geomicrobium sp. JSM 1781026]|uniref:RNase adapter RapZ n=1 Tax=Geomicrobium sp. JSM 1781026 TaxID=3344580 RepID=UPI0035BFB378